MRRIASYVPHTEWADKLETDDQQITTLSEFSKMRAGGYETYALFCDNFLSCVVGKLRYRKLVRGQRMTHVATSSDEAFALLLLENNYDRWLDVHNNSKGQAQAHETPPGKTKRWESDVSPKFTVGGLLLTGGSRKYKGWTDAGIVRYNELFHAVSLDRKRNREFTTRYLDTTKKAYEAAKGLAQTEDDGTGMATPQRATHQLWANDTDSEEEYVSADEETPETDSVARQPGDKDNSSRSRSRSPTVTNSAAV